MAKAVGVSKDTVQRVWVAHGLKPHLVKTFKLSNDPQNHLCGPQRLMKSCPRSSVPGRCSKKIQSVCDTTLAGMFQQSFPCLDDAAEGERPHRGHSVLSKATPPGGVFHQSGHRGR